MKIQYVKKVKKSPKKNQTPKKKEVCPFCGDVFVSLSHHIPYCDEYIELNHRVLLTAVNTYLKAYKKAYKNAKGNKLSEVKLRYEEMLKQREALKRRLDK